VTSRRLPDAAAAAGVFLVCWGLVHTWFWARYQLVDWPTYRDYGTSIWHDGRVPYRDFGVEYPPGALPVFVAPAPFADYAQAFAWLMAGCGVALVGILAFVRREAAWYAALAPVLVGSLILSRFDLWPTLLVVVSLGALLANRHRLGWAFLGAAVAAKLWPLAIVPVALVWSARRGRAASSLVGLAVAGVAFVPFFLVSPGGMWHSLEGQASRPLQVESLGAALFTTFGHPRVETTHGSQSVIGHGAVGVLMTVVEIAALLALWVAFARGAATSERLVRYAAASVCAFVAFGKVLSPQYLIWLIPLVPLVRGARGAAATVALTAACLLTQVWFPLRYWRYADDFHLAWVVLLRDLVLVALLCILALPRPMHDSPSIHIDPGRD
jgi:Glycosyltransferase family 87